MKTLLTIITLLFVTLTINAQTIDTLITTPIYKSYFSYSVREPLMVTYKLYKAGGTNSRAGMVFKTGGLRQSATPDDYAKSGYDIGHMATAADFAYNATAQESTFRFYNALPQLPRLNRGVWKKLETDVRQQSQSDSLFVICGGYQFDTKLNNRIGVPKYCFKIIKSLSKNTIKCYIFPNDNSNTSNEISLSDLLKNIPSLKSKITEILNRP
jgi:endonuclease G